MTFRLANTSLNTVSYSRLCMLYGLPDEMWDAGNVVCYGSGILSMWDVGDVRNWGCEVLGICDVIGMGYWGYGMLRMWYVRDTGCSRCGMF